jgi:hypothetical protein
MKALLLSAAAIGLSVLVAVGALLGAAPGSPPAALAQEIPPAYLELYRSASSRYELGADGWAYLAAVGKIECDHGRSPLVGCRRGEANSAGARGPAQFLAATWIAYGVDADGDGDRDIYDPADAVFGMANYLRAGGAPNDWRRALFAYNHSGAYVDDVLAQASAYLAPEPGGAVVSGGGDWLAPLPGFPSERCDARIVPDVLALVRAFRIHVSDCHGGEPHALNGEHPLGLAIDASPADGDWRRTEALARSFGWRESCARSGCPGRGPFRLVLYNGYPGHGDPRHARSPHIHLSWEHAPAVPFTRAAWVRLALPTSSAGAAR